VAHSDDGDGVEGAIGDSVSAAAQPVPAAAGGLGADSAELGEGGFTRDPLGVIAGGDQELTRPRDPPLGGHERHRTLQALPHQAQAVFEGERSIMV